MAASSLFSLSIFFLAVLASHLVSGARLAVHDASFTPTTILRVTEQPASVACVTKDLILINGTSPGPELRMKEGQTTWIRVYNDLPTENLTIHWHGLTQSVAPFSDGTPLASQWPILPGHFFDYEVHPGVGEAGTYFYHSHVNFQAVSAAGPLIVEEADGASPPYQYDGEKMIFLSELYNKTSQTILDGLFSRTDFTWSGETETILVNGQSYPAQNAAESQAGPQNLWSHPLTDAFQICGPEIIDVDPGKTYRFRTIGGEALSLVSYSFEDHDTLTIIAADGRYTKPAVTDHIQAGPGQRFDYLLETKTTQQLDQLHKTWFWIQLQTEFRPTDVTYYAVLRYNYTVQHNLPFLSQPGIPNSPPLLTPLSPPSTTDVTSWLEYTLEPFTPNNFPSNSEVTRRVYLTSAGLNSANGSASWWGVNNHTWSELDENLNNTPYNSPYIHTGVPYLVNIFNDGDSAIPNYTNAVDNYGGWDPELNVYAAKVGEVIDIILLNQPDGTSTGYDFHPWHIHGGHIYDIGSGEGEYDEEENYRRLEGWSPAMRDVTYLYKYTTGDGVGTLEPYHTYGWRAWRLRVDYAGVWMVHCHILQHMVMGMQTVWVMGNASEITQHAEPYVAGYLDFAGSAYGNASYDPLVYEHFATDGRN